MVRRKSAVRARFAMGPEIFPRLAEQFGALRSAHSHAFRRFQKPVRSCYKSCRTGIARCQRNRLLKSEVLSSKSSSLGTWLI